MSDVLISRKLALEAVCHNCCDNSNCDGGCVDYMEIANISTVEATSVVHAKWDYDGTCNNCNAQVLSNYTRFCPSCGAKMDGK